MGEFISTDDVSEEERLSYWNDLVCRTFVRVEVTSLLDGTLLRRYLSPTSWPM